MTAPRSILERPKGPGLAALWRGREARTGFLRHWLGGGIRNGIDLVTHTVLGLLPLDAASAFGARSARLRGPTVYREAHERAAANFRRLNPAMSEDQIAEAGLDRWDNVGRLMAEYAVLPRMIAEGRVDIRGAEHLTQARSAGRGVVLLAVHLGNWEVAAAVLPSLGCPLSAFYEPQPTWSRDYLSRLARRRVGAHLLPLGVQGFKPALHALAQNQAVAVFGDECRRGEVQAPLFGRPAHPACNLAHAARLARGSGAPVLVAHVVRLDGGCRFQVTFSAPVALAASGRLRDDVAQLNAAIEPLVLAHLDQWYYLHERLAGT